MTADRLRCLVIGCNCTTKKDFHEWICAKHWRQVPRYLRNRYTKVKRMRRAALRVWRDDAARYDRVSVLTHRTWERCKRMAIERSVGL